MKKEEFTDYLLENSEQISDETLDFYDKNPKELELITNRELIQLGILKNFFFVAIILVAASRTLIYLLAGSYSGFLTEVVLEIVFEMGNAILGGVLAAFLIERLQRKQYEKNVFYKREVKRLLKKRKRS